MLNESDNEASRILDLRKILGVSNLTYIPKLRCNASFRAQTISSVDPYVLHAWQRICELETENLNIENELDVELLKHKIPEIKEIMFYNKASEIQGDLIKIFSDCGIAFQIVKNFKGAPVQGFIKTNNNDRLILCMTIRGRFADRFWFTLFHEIGHIVNGDNKDIFIDFESIDSTKEEKANKYSKDVLIDPKEYKIFLNKDDFSLESINDFATSQNVPNYIIIGRLQKDEIIGWDIVKRQDINGAIRSNICV